MLVRAVSDRPSWRWTTNASETNSVARARGWLATEVLIRCFTRAAQASVETTKGRRLRAGLAPHVRGPRRAVCRAHV